MQVLQSSLWQPTLYFFKKTKTKKRLSCPPCLGGQKETKLDCGLCWDSACECYQSKLLPPGGSSLFAYNNKINRSSLLHWLNNRGHSYVRLIFCVTDFQHTESIGQSIFFIAFCFAVSLCCLKVSGTGLLKHRWWQITRNYIWFLCDHFVFFHFVWPFLIHVFRFTHLSHH